MNYLRQFLINIAYIVFNIRKQIYEYFILFVIVAITRYITIWHRGHFPAQFLVYVYCVLCTEYCVLCTVYCVLCTVYCVLCTVYCVLCTVYGVLCTRYSVLCTVYCVLCTVYCVLCTVYCVLCTVYCVLCIEYCVTFPFLSILQACAFNASVISVLNVLTYSALHIVYCLGVSNTACICHG